MKERGNTLIRKADSLFGPILVIILSAFKRSRPRKVSPKTILFVKLGAIGDTLLLDGVGSALKEKLPHSSIYFVGTRTNMDVIRRFPWVREFLPFDLTKAFKNPFYFVSWVREMRERCYDVILDFEQWAYIDAVIVRLLRGDLKVGFKVSGRAKHMVFEIRVPHRRDIHEIENFRNLTSFLEPIERKTPLFLVAEEERQKISHLLEDISGPLIVFHPCCGGFKGHLREWPLEKFIELGKLLLRDHPRARIILTGSSDEVTKAERIREELGPSAINVAGKLTIGETAAIIEQADLFISGNTGTMHIAASLSTPLVALHGPTDVRRFGPFGQNSVVIESKAPCCPCLYLGFEYKGCIGGCMDFIEVEEVYAACKRILSPKAE